ncbi:MAG: MFS transporter [Chloroflexota bacterium]
MTTRGRGKPRSHAPAGNGTQPRQRRVAVPVKASMIRLRRAGREVQERLPKLPIGGEAARRSRMLTMEGLVPEAARYATYNFRRGVLNGVMFTLVDALIAPTLVLAWFISRLGAPNVLVGLLPAILSGGWFLPQMLVASRVQGLSHMMPWYARTGALRTVAVVLLCAFTVLLADQPVLLLISFFFFYSVYCFLGGVTGIPWLEVVGKVVAPRRRGSFFGQRNFWGGLLALLAAGPIGAILSEDLWGLTFPYNFALLFGITAVVVGLGVYFWSSVREPAATQSAPQVSVSALFKQGVRAYKTNVDYRNFMVARILISLASIADPFYVVYAKTNLGAPAATVGLYLGALSIASLLSNFLWSPLADRASNRLLMTLTVASVALVPFTAFIISRFVGAIDDDVLYPAFTLVFVLSGLALGAARIVNNNMLLTIAPPTERATYVGFLNTILGVVIFVPVLGGLLADLVGFEILFLLSLVLSALGLLASQRMSNKAPEHS